MLKKNLQNYYFAIFLCDLEQMNGTKSSVYVKKRSVDDFLLVCYILPALLNPIVSCLDSSVG